MDTTKILNPRTFVTDELERRSRERLREWTDEELRDFGRPATPEEAAERIAWALLLNIPVARALKQDAEFFAERTRQAACKPTPQNTSEGARTAWASGFVALHRRRDELTKAHEQIATHITTWRLKPGLGEADGVLVLTLNSIATALNATADALDRAGTATAPAEEATA